MKTLRLPNGPLSLMVKAPSLPQLMLAVGVSLLTFQSCTLQGRTDIPPIVQLGGAQSGTWQVELEQQKGTMTPMPTYKANVLDQAAEGRVTAVAIRRVVQKLSPTAVLPSMAQMPKLAEQSPQQANRARQSVAKQYIGSLNRAEQAFSLENNHFTVDFYELGLPIKSETDENYRYRLFLLQAPRISKAGGSKPVWSIALPKKPNLKSYVGVVWVNPTVRTDEFPILAILCESNRPTRQLPPAPTFQNGKSGLVANCPLGFSPLR